MPRSIHDHDLMKPADIAKLQRVFDKECISSAALPGSTEARDIAVNLVALLNAGMEDEASLDNAVVHRRPQPKAV